MTESDQLGLLNARFGFPGQLTFGQDLGELVAARIVNQHATATVALQGAHVVNYQLHDAQPLLFVSRQSYYTSGKAIRGGIPVCWPWFGPHPSDTTKPQHGFVRARPWQVLATHAHADGSTELRLGFSNDATTQALWPHAFTLELHISIGSTLKLALVMRNTDTTAWSCTGALHSYLAVGDIGAVTIDGLDTVAYVDKVAGGQLRRQEGPIVIDTEVDRVYQETTATCRIDDTAFARQITIAKAGSHSTVVWNPWQAKAAQLADMADDEYRAFVCVETTNAGDDIVTLAPGAEHRLELTLAQD